MNVSMSNLPRITNNATPMDGHLKQVKAADLSNAGGAVKTAEAGTPAAVMMKLAPLYEVGGDYTKADALQRQRQIAEGPKSLFDLQFSGFSELDDFEQKLQTDGLSVEFDERYWFMFSSDLKNVQFSANTATVASGAEFQKKADYLASRLAAMESVIKNNTSGKEQETQLAKLNEIAGAAAETLASGYAEAVGSYLEKLGVSGETEKIHDSVLSGIEARTDAYRAALSGNETLNALQGTADAWLLQDDAYVASVLRNTADVSASVAADAAYSLDDLTALGQLTSELAKSEQGVNVHNANEERLGLDLAVTGMKVDTLIKNGGVGAGMARTMQSAFDNFMREFLNRVDEQLQKGRDASLTAGDQRGFSALDKSAVLSVYSETMRQYEILGDTLKALQKGAEYGKGQFEKNADKNEGVYRYGATLFWDGFTKEDGAFTQYAAGLLDFTNSTSSGEAPRLNTALHSADWYGLGNLVDLLA